MFRKARNYKVIKEHLSNKWTTITPDTALRLALGFRLGTEGHDNEKFKWTTIEFWMNLQHGYERECGKDYLIKQENKVSRRKQKNIIKEIQPLPNT